jgi:hypothetical protein
MSQLEKLILKLRLSLHDKEVRHLLPLALNLEKEGIINEVLDWVIIVREIEIRVDEGNAHIEVLKKFVYCIRFLAIIIGSNISTFEKANLQVLEIFRIKISIQLVVLLYQAIMFGDFIHLDLLLV